MVQKKAVPKNVEDVARHTERESHVQRWRRSAENATERVTTHHVAEQK